MIPKIIIFDLDGTLAMSKQALTSEMAALIAKLLAVTKIAVISGGALPQFLTQVVAQLPNDANFSNLYLLPTSGAALYEFDPSTSLRTGNGDWKKIYEEHLSEREAQIIETAMREAAEETGIVDFSKPVFGERIEYRGSQVTLSALGQQAPIAEKMVWDPDRTKRRALREAVAARLSSEFLVCVGGKTSIDVTKDGIDKAYGIHQLCTRLGIPESETLYVGDELESGGNDEAVYKTDTKTKSVANPADTEKFIKEILNANA